MPTSWERLTAENDSVHARPALHSLDTKQDRLTSSTRLAQQEKAHSEPPQGSEGWGRGRQTKAGKIEGHSSSCRVNVPKIADVGLLGRRNQRARGLERRGNGGLSSSPLSESGPRGDPPLPRATAGRSRPSGSLVPSKGSGQSGYPIPGPGTPRNAPPEYLVSPNPDGAQ